MSRPYRDLETARTISAVTALFLCLFLTGCYFHSRQPLLYANDDFPFYMDVLQLEERSLEKGAWTDPTPHQLRRTGPSTYVGITERSPDSLRLDDGLNREIRFEQLRPGFFAAMWKHDGDISGVPNGYFYDLVYVESERRHIYRWSLDHILRIGDRPYISLYQFCSERYRGPPKSSASISITFNDRATLFTVLRGCIDEIVSRRIPPSYRYRWM